MAYYAQDLTKPAVQPGNGLTDGLGEVLRADGVGAYYAYDATHEAVEPVNGLALGTAGALSDDAIRGVVGRRAPAMIAGEWAVRAGDVKWRPVVTGHDLTLIPITDAELARVRAMAFGHEAPTVALLLTAPASETTLRLAFEGSPYAYEKLVAVYNVARPSSPPSFLAFGTLRDAADEDGGSRRMQDVAMLLRGVLVYPIALPSRGRPRLPPIERALTPSPAAASAPMGFVAKGAIGALGSVGKAELALGAVGALGVLALGYLVTRRP